MKQVIQNFKRVLSLLLAVIVVMAWSGEVMGQFTIASDNAGNYSGNWTGNQGTGFNSWSFVANGGESGFAGRIIGNPSAGGISGMNASSFGLFANPNVSGNESKARRTFAGGELQIGDTFSFQMGLNWDGGNSSAFKGIDFFSSSGAVRLNFNMGSSATITWGAPGGTPTGGTLFSAYGTQAMNFQITRVSSTQYRVVATPRTGSTNFDQTITLASTINGFEFYAGRLDAGDARQPYYNNLSITNSGAFNIASGTETYSRSLSGTGNLSKSGAGTLVLSGNNTYTGTTTVSGGTLRATGNISGSAITVQSGATFEVGASISTGAITVANGGTLVVEAGHTLTAASVTIQDGATVTINGNLVVSETLNIAAENTLVVPSGRNLIATTIEYNGTGNIEFQRQLTAPEFTEEVKGRWVALSSPVSSGNFAGSGGLLENIWTQGFIGANTLAGAPNVLEYSGTAYVVPSGNSMTPGKGFLVFLYEKEFGEDGVPIDYAVPLSARGTVNSAPFDFNSLLSHNGIGANDSWNLLGNPLSAGFDWTKVVSENLTGYAYILNPEIGQYIVTEGGATGGTVQSVLSAGNNIIAPFQAFWVKTTAEGASLSIPTDALTTNNPNSGLFKEATSTFAFGLHLDVNGYESNTGVRLGEGFSEQFSSRDAYFLTPLASTHAYLYSVTDDIPTLLKSLPSDFEGEISLPVNAGFNLNGRSTVGNATLTWSGIENLPADLVLSIQDNLTGVVTDLAAEEAYTFETTVSTRAKSASNQNSPVMQNTGSARFTLIISRAGTTNTEITSDLPASVTLAQNFPNPFNPSTNISFSIPENAHVRLAVYDLLGRQVAQVVDAPMVAGFHTVTFDASSLTSGVYVYRIEAAGQVSSRRMTLLK